jgi:hypothetical protein
VAEVAVKNGWEVDATLITLAYVIHPPEAPVIFGAPATPNETRSDGESSYQRAGGGAKETPFLGFFWEFLRAPGVKTTRENRACVKTTHENEAPCVV